MAGSIGNSFSLSERTGQTTLSVVEEVRKVTKSTNQGVSLADSAIRISTGLAGVTRGHVAFSYGTILLAKFVWLETVSCFTNVAN